VQGRLDHVRIGDAGVRLLPDLHLEDRELGHLAIHPPEALLDVLTQLVGDGHVATLDLDLHGDPLVGDVAGHTVEPGAPLLNGLATSGGRARR
jgi:hypothetical protein